MSKFPFRKPRPDPVEFYETWRFAYHGMDQSKLSEWRFRVKGRNGEIVASSEGYTTKSAAIVGAGALKRLMKDHR